MTLEQKQPTLYLSLPHECSYLPGQTATTLFIDPAYPVDSHLYQELLQIGFRRSGELVYRPRCGSCSACVPIRVPVNQFSPNRSQKRAWSKNQDIEVISCKPEFNSEHFELYQRYQKVRHTGSSMDDSDPQKYIDFLANKHLSTTFYELRHDQQLLAVAITDRLPDSFSAVYTFFDPNESRRSLGVYAVLWQIREAKRLGLNWLYLGYWIQECQKMAYKADYRPLEGLTDDYWQPVQS